ncbi:hypothetical protein C8Q80DRAFT_1212276, partial [Daedaleopsis nitida]
QSLRGIGNLYVLRCISVPRRREKHNSSRLALLAYEWLITVGQEVELFWKAPLTGATILLALNRYILLLASVLGFISPRSLFSCTFITWLSFSLQVSIYVPWAAFSAMRAYALSGRQRCVTALVLVFSGIPVIANLLQVYWAKAIIDPIYGCQLGSDMSETLDTATMTVTVASRSSLIIADAMIIAITWLTIYQTVKLSTGPGLQAGSSSSFSRVFLVNALSSLCRILLALNILDFVTVVLQIKSILGGSYLIQIVDTLTSILISRFLLDLQAVRKRTHHQSSLDPASSSIIFDRVMGAINSELQQSDLQILSGEGVNATEAELTSNDRDEDERTSDGDVSV